MRLLLIPRSSSRRSEDAQNMPGCACCQSVTTEPVVTCCSLLISRPCTRATSWIPSRSCWTSSATRPRSPCPAPNTTSTRPARRARRSSSRKTRTHAADVWPSLGGSSHVVDLYALGDPTLSPWNKEKVLRVRGWCSVWVLLPAAGCRAASWPTRTSAA